MYLSKFDNMSVEELKEYIKEFRSDNIFAIAELLYHGVSVEEIHEITMITPFFLEAFKNIIDMEEQLRVRKDAEILTAAKKMGFGDKYIARMWNCTEMDVYNMRKELNLFPAFKMVDTCHTNAYIPYFYSSYTGENTSILTDKKKIIVLGAEK
jgi:carbamoyl-phosphate synthase large subunit